MGVNSLMSKMRCSLSKTIGHVAFKDGDPANNKPQDASGI